MEMTLDSDILKIFEVPATPATPAAPVATVAPGGDLVAAVQTAQAAQASQARAIDAAYNFEAERSARGAVSGQDAEMAAMAQAAQTVMQLATGYMGSAALHVATRLNIAEQLADGPMTIDALAQQSGVKADPLYRVMRALAAAGLFEEQAARTFALTRASALLRAHPGSLRDIAMFLTDRMHFRTYGEMMHTVETGQPAIERVAGVPVFELFARDVDESELFNDAMTSMSAAIIPAVLQAYDFSGVTVLADIAGGHGRMLGEILRTYPDMSGMLFDIDHVVAGAYANLAAMEIADRCETLSGDFFYSVPRGADTYLMKHIIHDWDDDKAGIILRNVRAALADRADGRLLLVESVIPSGSASQNPHIATLGDLEMMLLPGGRERTADEFRVLLASAGFELTRIIPTASMVSVIEARIRSSR